MNLTSHLLLGTAGGSTFWTNLSTAVQTWAEKGAATSGLKALAWVLIAVGILGIGISILVKKFSQQARIPGWFSFLVTAFVGVILLEGPNKIVALLTNAKDTLFSWLGV